METGSDLVTIAVIRKARGIRGEVATTPLSDYPERFAPGLAVTLVPERGKSRPATLENVWFQKDTLILKFAGIDTMTEAETLAGWRVCVPLAERVAPDDENEFFIDELVGCRVELEDGSYVGDVSDVYDSGGGQILEVLAPGGPRKREHLIPFTRAFCPDVDIAAKRIRIAPPEGLLDL